MTHCVLKPYNLIWALNILWCPRVFLPPMVFLSRHWHPLAGPSVTLSMCAVAEMAVFCHICVCNVHVCIYMCMCIYMSMCAVYLVCIFLKTLKHSVHYTPQCVEVCLSIGFSSHNTGWSQAMPSVLNIGTQLSGSIVLLDSRRGRLATLRLRTHSQGCVSMSQYPGLPLPLLQSANVCHCYSH